MRTLKLLAIAAVSLGLSACGNSIESKEDAAAAMQRLAYATSKAAVQKPELSGALDESLTVTVKGTSGSATVRFIAADSGLSAEVAYDEFSADGVNTFDGSLAASASIDLANLLQGMSLALSMKGAVTMSGDYDSALEVDLAFSMAVNDLENLAGASVSVRLDGRVVADGEEYLFSDESLTIETAER